MKLRLAGSIYHDRARLHFVANVVDKEGGIWYHDSITAGVTCERCREMTSINSCDMLNPLYEASTSVAIYVTD